MRKLLRYIGRTIAGGLWLVTLGAGALLGVCWLWPVPLGGGGAVDRVAGGIAFGTAVLHTHLALGGLVMAIAAAAGRRWVLAGVAVALVGVAVVGQHRPLWVEDRPAAGPAALRVMTANVYFGNRDLAGLLAAVERFRPDVLLVQEQTPIQEAALSEALADSHPYQVHDSRWATDGFAAYANRPIARRPAAGGGGGDSGGGGDPVLAHKARRYVTRAGGRELAIWNVHPSSPSNLTTVAKNADETRRLIAALAAEDLPAIVAGDFNQTPASPAARALDAANLPDALALIGKNPRATWPFHRPARPRYMILDYLPGVQIDYVRLSPHFTATSATIGPGNGSDHAPVIADVAWAAE